MSATKDQRSWKFQDADSPPPFIPKHPHCPGPALARTHSYVAAASPLYDSCATATVLPANKKIVANKNDRIRNSPQFSLSAPHQFDGTETVADTLLITACSY